MTYPRFELPEGGHVQVFADASELVEAAAAWIGERAQKAVEQRGRFSVALAGGGTPRPVYQRLAREPWLSAVPWESVDVYFGDERAVPRDHPESNYAMAKQALLDRVAAHVFPMNAQAADLAEAASAYEQALPEALDLAILGIGEDGHTASLFPGSAAVGERTRRVASVVGPKPPPQRLTLTPAALEQARMLLVLVTGAGKAAVLKQILQGPLAVESLPAQLARRGTWMIDAAAAAELAPGSNP